jgi:hypothetical protein
MMPSWTTRMFVLSLLSCAGACVSNVGTGPIDEQTGTARTEEDGSQDETPTSTTQNSASVAGEEDADAGAKQSDPSASDDTPPPADTPPPTQQEDKCATAAADAREVLETRCGACHDAFPGSGSFAGVLDAQGMIDDEKVVPNQPDMSRVYIRMSEGTMPPSGAVPDPELQKVRTWIECNAPDFPEGT